MCGPMGDSKETASRYIFEQLGHEGIETRHIVQMPGLVTPISGIMIDPTGERTIVTFRDPALWKVQLPSADALLDDCAAILVESRCAEFSTDLCAEARRRGIPVVVDVDRAMSLSEGLLTASSHLVFSSEPLQETPAFPVHTVDTLGAGDVFHGAFTLAITEGQPLQDALRFASAAAALKCTRYGGAFAAPQRIEVEALLGRERAASPEGLTG